MPSSRAARAAAVGICAAMREAGHPAGPGEARETVRLAARPGPAARPAAPGRGELVEALRACWPSGRCPAGAWSAVARAMEQVLVGDAPRARWPPAPPGSGLGPAVRELLARRLATARARRSAQELRLDPLRSDLDRRRRVTLQRLVVCGVAYAEPADGSSGPASTRSPGAWRVEWTPATAATSSLPGSTA